MPANQDPALNDMVEAVIHEGNEASARTVLLLRRGYCLAISALLVRFARSRTALDDPLGNGVLAALEIPSALAPQWISGSGFLQEQSGGAVLLNGGTVLLVKPFAIELYASGMDALHARDCRGQIDLSVL